ncbi:hypothetical protein ABK040_000230 [Willaertia magna]
MSNPFNTLDRQHRINRENLAKYDTNFVDTIDVEIPTQDPTTYDIQKDRPIGSTTTDVGRDLFGLPKHSDKEFYDLSGYVFKGGMKDSEDIGMNEPAGGVDWTNHDLGGALGEFEEVNMSSQSQPQSQQQESDTNQNVSMYIPPHTFDHNQSLLMNPSSSSSHQQQLNNNYPMDMEPEIELALGKTITIKVQEDNASKEVKENTNNLIQPINKNLEGTDRYLGGELGRKFAGGGDFGTTISKGSEEGTTTIDPLGGCYS